MSERAHPDDPHFRGRLEFRFRRGFVPWIAFRPSPFKVAMKWRYKWVSQSAKGKDVLDIPCGTGWGTSMIRGAKSLTGLDISEDALNEARRRYGSRANFEVGDMEKLNFPDESIDLVCCLEGIEHVPVDTGEAFLREVHRVLRDGGTLMISSPYCATAPHSGNAYHVHEYQPDEIKAALSKYFDISELVSRDVNIMKVLYITCIKRKS